MCQLDLPHRQEAGHLPANTLTCPGAIAPVSAKIGRMSGRRSTRRWHQDGFMGRRGKFARLVDDFVATVDRLGGQVDPATVAEELQDRIDAIA
ncbi:hypothetical protein Prum_067660 [Phytohabitans rumicis]|uniref:Uncharacterized protein n=1 Tax=Phytohabitans rumicis TaxID=1076125 RepID=A0A6V8L9W3_9ACTN|nr:hypothetical protein Prum_067660 [Phytohabitans rumicis]